MLFMTTYRVKPFLSQSETKKLLDLFGKVGAAPGTIAHYVAADNTAGWTVTEAPDAASGYVHSAVFGVHRVRHEAGPHDRRRPAPPARGVRIGPIPSFVAPPSPLRKV
jgi:hypothetical protein